MTQSPFALPDNHDEPGSSEPAKYRPYGAAADEHLDPTAFQSAPVRRGTPKAALPLVEALREPVIEPQHVEGPRGAYARVFNDRVSADVEVTDAPTRSQTGRLLVVLAVVAAGGAGWYGWQNWPLY